VTIHLTKHVLKTSQHK